MSGKNYTHIAANGNTNVAAAPVELCNVCINSLGASSNILTLYDTNTGSAAGNVIGVFSTTATVVVLNFNVQCKLGLFAVMSGGTAGDVTLVWG